MKHLFTLISTEKIYSAAALLIGAVAGAFALWWYYYTIEIWSGVPPHHIEDSLFYFARMKEIVDGYIFFGNPFYIEHRNGVAPSFTISDWFAAIPLAITHSWALTIAINTILWNSLYTFFTYKFLKTWGFGGLFGLCGVVAALSQTYLHLQRPVHIQISAVFFLILLVAFSKWFLVSENNAALFEKNGVFLAIILALGTYTYTFVGQIGFVLLGIVFLWAVVMRNKKVLQNILLIGILALVLVTPLIIFLYGVTLNKFYADSMGMVYSHAPTVTALNFSRVLFVGLVLVIAGSVFFRQHFIPLHRKFFLVISFLCGSMLVVSFSNVITGKYLEFGEHVKQFSYPVVMVMFLACIKYGIELLPKLRKKKFVFVIMTVLMLLTGIFLVRNAYLRNQLRFFDLGSARHAQTFAAPLTFLDTHEQDESVVLTSENLSPYVSIVSKHYTAYTFQGYIFAPPPFEQNERLRLSQLYDMAQNNVKIAPEQKAEFNLLLEKFNVKFFIWEKFPHAGDITRLGVTVQKLYEDDGYIVYKR